MKVAGFTFIRNAIIYDFPVIEAITSVLPLCDLFVVAVGRSEDDTLGLIRSIPDERIRIVETTWDQGLNQGGAVYAEETNKAFDAIPDGYDWCFYIQADEVLHEKYLDAVRDAMVQWLPVKKVEGLVFTYRHFYGTYGYTGDSRHWYRREARIIRNDKTIRSYRDAQGFRKAGKKINAVLVQAEIYHYGWVRHPKYMQMKIDAVKEFYDGISHDEAQKKAVTEEFSYSRNYDSLVSFTGTHPGVMQERISRLNWDPVIDIREKRMNIRYKVLYWFEKLTGIRPFEFRNYRIIRDTHG